MLSFLLSQAIARELVPVSVEEQRGELRNTTPSPPGSLDILSARRVLNYEKDKWVKHANVNCVKGNYKEYFDVNSLEECMSNCERYPRCTMVVYPNGDHNEGYCGLRTLKTIEDCEKTDKKNYKWNSFLSTRADCGDGNLGDDCSACKQAVDGHACAFDNSEVGVCKSINGSNKCIVDCGDGNLGHKCRACKQAGDGRACKFDNSDVGACYSEYGPQPGNRWANFWSYECIKAIKVKGDVECGNLYNEGHCYKPLDTLLENSLLLSKFANGCKADTCCAHACDKWIQLEYSVDSKGNRTPNVVGSEKNSIPCKSECSKKNSVKPICPGTIDPATGWWSGRPCRL